MAEAKSAAPKVEYRHNVAIGRHELGVRQGKSFVAFATVDDAVFNQRVENAENIAEANGEDEGGEE